uniref:NYN domain-containing protein n=1 Tax=Guillardia theta TaxID=55529 RepID=A0A7S4N4N5_GUITH|mmetsp:Transcript_16741/g.55682  ORF Transcript_16741/g.55682 Transcript_16741/m.55682 type:complete len:350 (+) Transcript_16741:151-1200(+)
MTSRRLLPAALASLVLTCCFEACGSFLVSFSRECSRSPLPSLSPPRPPPPSLFPPLPRPLPSCLPSRTVCEAKKKSGGKQGSSGEASDGGEGRMSPRIRSDIGISMKTQLKIVKAYREMERASTKMVTRTKFRRAKASGPGKEDEMGPEVLSNIWAREDVPPIFFVDGYNVIGQWNKLKKKRDNGDISGARDVLYDEISQFAHYRGCQCTIVYDAVGYTAGLPITQAEMTRAGVEVVYVRDESADTYIQARTAEISTWKEKDGIKPPKVYMCSSDRAISDIATGHGALVLSSALFIQEIKRAKKEMEGSYVDPSHASLQGTMIEDRIRPESASALVSLMEQLEGRKIRD